MPTNEELIAEVAALKHRLAQLEATTLFPPEQMVTRQQTPPPHKTNQVPSGPVPTPQQLATVRALMVRRVKSTDPVVIQGQIDSITTVITSGVNSAGYGDKRTEFRSLSELRQILAGLEEDLAGALGAGGRIRQIRMTTQADKGL
jgi:hypothetical protein